MNCKKCNSTDLRPTGHWSKMLWCPLCGEYTYDPDFVHEDIKKIKDRQSNFPNIIIKPDVNLDEW